MVAPPNKTELVDTYPNPSNAVFKAGIGKLFDYVTALLGTTGTPADARAALGAGDVTKAVSQSGALVSSAAGGTADAITGTYSPAITALVNGMALKVRAALANATTTPTFTPNSGTIAAKTIVKGAGAALVAGDIAGGGHWIELQYDSTLDKWVLLNPATGVSAQSSKQLQSLTASVASNALTVTYGGGTLDFRNAALSNGTPISGVVVASNSITVPSGATLGTVSGKAARLVLIEAYNAGAPVLCVTNTSGGVQLDETNLISPTTISAGATSASVIYSASAVAANSPYRVVGIVDITEATAGTWAAAPTTVQGCGGQAVATIALNASGAAPIYACRAWVNFNGTGTVAIRASGNVSSITDNGTGDYTVNFTTPMPDANYATTYGYAPTLNGSAAAARVVFIYSAGTNELRITSKDNAGNGADFEAINVTIFR